jgi:hypothetical protein
LAVPRPINSKSPVVLSSCHWTLYSIDTERAFPSVSIYSCVMWYPCVYSSAFKSEAKLITWNRRQFPPRCFTVQIMVCCKISRSLVGDYTGFGGRYCLHHQNRSYIFVDQI